MCCYLHGTEGGNRRRLEGLECRCHEIGDRHQEDRKADCSENTHTFFKINASTPLQSHVGLDNQLLEAID